MKVTKDGCKRQVARLALVPVFRPPTKAAVEGWVNCLMRHCQDDAHAERAMTAMLETVVETTNPLAQFCAIARQLLDHGKPPAGCDRCFVGPDGTTGEVRWAAHVSFDPPGGGNSYAARCDCARGQWLSAREKQGAPAPEKKAKHSNKLTPTAPADWARAASRDVDE
jgi:hypothetical protein